jgi:hypothetical protein
MQRDPDRSARLRSGERLAREHVAVIRECDERGQAAPLRDVEREEAGVDRLRDIDERHGRRWAASKPGFELRRPAYRHRTFRARDSRLPNRRGELHPARVHPVTAFVLPKAAAGELLERPAEAAVARRRDPERTALASDMELTHPASVTGEHVQREPRRRAEAEIGDCFLTTFGAGSAFEKRTSLRTKSSTIRCRPNAGAATAVTSTTSAIAAAIAGRRLARVCFGDGGPEAAAPARLRTSASRRFPRARGGAGRAPRSASSRSSDSLLHARRSEVWAAFSVAPKVDARGIARASWTASCARSGSPRLACATRRKCR